MTEPRQSHGANVRMPDGEYVTYSEATADERAAVPTPNPSIGAYRCVCGEDVTAQVIRKQAGPPRSERIVAVCQQGHYTYQGEDTGALRRAVPTDLAGWAMRAEAMLILAERYATDYDALIKGGYDRA